MQESDVVEVETGKDVIGSVIWLHGLGADGHDFEPIVPELQLPPDMPLRFVFPHAPVRPVTLNGGMAMRAWYDIVSLDREGRADAEGVQASSNIVAELVQREIDRGIASNRIVIAGFSQGGAVAMHYVLHSAEKLRGLMALSTYMAAAPGDSLRVDPDLPIFMAHGTEDPMVPVTAGQESAERLRSLGYTVDWHEYPMMHAVCLEEIAAISAWLKTLYSSLAAN